MFVFWKKAEMKDRTIGTLLQQVRYDEAVNLNNSNDVYSAGVRTDKRRLLTKK